MARFKIGSRWVGCDEPLYVVAEAGVNHENSLATAERMIQEAARCGADAVKFQCYKAGSLASRDSPAYWDRNEEPADSQYELFSRYDRFGPDDYRKLARCAAENRITFLTTAFDEAFADELGDLLPAFKVASADITHVPLLKRIASKRKPVLLSTGAATLEEIREALILLRSHGCPHVALLHCVLNYPCPPERANLRTIPALQRVFPEVVVGYSDHVPARFNLLQLNMAWMLGARIVEKHFTLDKTKPGNDHYHAMDPEDLRLFRQQQAYLENLLGSGALGDRASEELARRYARRSLVASRRVAAGQRVTREEIGVKRPGTGIPPKEMESLIGRCASRDIEEDTVFQWDMFEP
jgi:N-acetylneuraminate synthase